MFFSDYSTFIYVGLFILIYNLVKLFTNNGVVRNSIILGGNLFILLTLVKEHTLIVIAVLSLLVYLSGFVLQKKKIKLFLGFVLTLIITLFSIRNYPFVQDLLNESYLEMITGPILSVQKIGLSYILFRFVHWVIESYKGAILKSNFLTFLSRYPIL